MAGSKRVVDAADDTPESLTPVISEFSAVTRDPTLSDKVTDLLLDSILSQGVRPGARLPSERELAQQFGVSRTVVREAIRSLAAKGVIEVRSGRGLRVASVGASSVSESMKLFLHGRGPLDYEKVHEVRTMLEVHMAGLSCQRATRDEITQLAEVHEHMERMRHDMEKAAQADVEFHRTIARLTHNELYVIMLESIEDVLLEVRRATMRLPGRLAKAVRYHRTILDHIVDGNEESAKEAMRSHLEESLQVWNTLKPST